MKIYIIILVSLLVQPVLNFLFNEDARGYTTLTGRSNQNKDEAKSERTRIFFGETVKLGEYPYAAALLRRSPAGREQFCGGVLYTLKHVLTACHCVINSDFTMKNPKDVEVTAGGVQVSEEEFERGETQLRLAVLLRRHPGCYLNKNKTLVAYDMAALRVDYPFVITENLNVLKVPFHESHDHIDSLSRRSPACTTVGWGLMEGFKSSVELRKMPLVLRSPEKCAELVFAFSKGEKRGPDQFRSKYHVCASGINPNQTACGGDSGAPLMCKDGKKTTIIGILSYAPGTNPCGQTGIPTVFARIELFYEEYRNDLSHAPTHVSYASSLLILVALIVINVVHP